jgi:uncharacterized protein YgfB (UPF0149 family)
MSDLELKAVNASSLLAPGELHGLVCGLAVTNDGGFPYDEFVDLAGADALTDEDSVKQFVSAALENLVDEELAFAPLVPDDERVLSLRVGALADFCAGFLSGFGAGVKTGRADLPVDIQEIIRDFASISGIDEEAAEDEQDESSYTEIYEYVRVGVMLVMTLMARPAVSDA